MRAIILALTLSMGAQAHAQTPPSVEAFGRLPAIADAAISPDGNRVALAMAPLNGAPFISVLDMQSRSVVYTARVEEGVQLRGVNWADDGRVSFIISQTFHPGQVLPGNMRFRGRPRRVDYYRTGVIDLATRELRLLTTNEDEPWQDQGSRLISPTPIGTGRSPVSRRATSSVDGPATNGAGSAASKYRAASSSHSGTAATWAARPSCCTPNKVSATAFRCCATCR